MTYWTMSTTKQRTPDLLLRKLQLREMSLSPLLSPRPKTKMSSFERVNMTSNSLESKRPKTYSKLGQGWPGHKSAALGPSPPAPVLSFPNLRATPATHMLALMTHTLPFLLIPRQLKSTCSTTQISNPVPPLETVPFSALVTG